MHSSLTLRSIDVPHYTVDKVARMLGDRLGPFIGGEAYSNSHNHLYRFQYLTEPLSTDRETTFPLQGGIHLPPPQAGLDYVKYTLTLVAVPICD